MTGWYTPEPVGPRARTGMASGGGLTRGCGRRGPARKWFRARFRKFELMSARRSCGTLMRVVQQSQLLDGTGDGQ